MNRMRYALACAVALAGCGGTSTTPAPPDMAMMCGPTMPPPQLGITAGKMATPCPTGNECQAPQFCDTTLNPKICALPANYSCLGTRMDPPGPSMDVVVTGLIKDFQDNNVVMGATVTLWKNAADVPDPAKAIATSMAPSDANGNYMIKVPAGTPYRVIRGNSGGKAISNGNPVDTIPAYEFNRNFDDKSPVAVKTSTREAIPGLVSVIPDPTLGVLAGSVRDCMNTEVGNALVAVSMTSVMYDGVCNTFYFADVGGSTLPTRTIHYSSEANGTFAALNVPPGLATLTVTGIVGSGAAKTISTATVPVQGGAVTIVEMLPLSM
jgi:hypothetical protein